MRGESKRAVPGARGSRNVPHGAGTTRASRPARRSLSRLQGARPPAITIATPVSWTAEGASDRSSAPRKTVLTGWSISTIEVSTAGRRGSDTEMSSQPSTCEESASSTSQACDSRPGTQSDVADRDSAEGREDRGAERGVEQRSRRPPLVHVPLAQDQDEERVRDRREQAEDHAHQRIVAVRALPTTPEIRTTPANTTGIEASARLSGLAERRPGKQPHEDDLDVAEHRGQPGAHRLDRVVPEREVGGEHETRHPERHPLARRRLSERRSSSQASRPRARAARTRSEEGRRGGHLGQPHEDPGERDHERAEQHAEYRPVQSRRPRLAVGIVPPVDRDVLWTLVVFFGASICSRRSATPPRARAWACRSCFS